MAASSMTLELTVAVPPQKMWKALSDSQLLPKAVAPVIVAVEEDGGLAVGSTRVIRFNPELVGFPYSKEQLTVYDEANMTLGSALLEGGFIGSQLKSQSATITFKPHGENGTLLIWVCEYEPLVENPEVEKVKEGYVATIKAIEAYLLANSDY